VGDQVLRMDYVNERRMWEGEMARRAAQELEGDVEMEIDVEEQNISPTEEKEIEELVGYLDQPAEEEDEYDQIFQEIIGQQQHDAMDMS
jgi:hypothetical protein